MTQIPVPTKYECGCPIMYNERAWQMILRRCPEHGQRIKRNLSRTLPTSPWKGL